MGLAASQARLLTITSRKSDCEYQSMALSHQKIALSRDMNIVSSEYQNSLDKKKIVYDFYGTHDKSTPLSYGLLMKPSELNEFMPTPVTDNAGRVVLTPDLARAAELAGIPREGLGCTPSSDIRNLFLQGLINSGAITQTTGVSAMTTQYNPYAGFGSSELLTYSVEPISLQQYIDSYLEGVSYDFSNLTLESGGSFLTFCDLATGNEYHLHGSTPAHDTSANITLKKLIEGNYALYGAVADYGFLISNDGSEGGATSTYGGQPPIPDTCAVDKVGTCSFWNVLFNSLAAAIDPADNMAQAALQYAQEMVLEKVISLGNTDFSNAAYNQGAQHSGLDDVLNEAKQKANTYVGYVHLENHANKKSNDGYSINLSNMTRAFFTYFAMYMQGLASTEYKVENTVSASNFVTDHPSDFAINVITDVDTTGNNLLVANFYDALFNQIAINGWVENSHMNDNEYLATMLRNGTMFLSSISDDDYYYQSNYATNKYIKEVTDEEGIAKAEAKYQREKRRIQNKESIIDMKMKNLDTEISALNQEYNSIKGIISNSVKNSFTRYDA